MRKTSVRALPTALITAITGLSAITLAVPLTALPAAAATPPPAESLKASAASLGVAAKAPAVGAPETTVVLPTGDLVRITTGANGHRTVATQPAAGTGAHQATITQTLGADTYVTPLDALRYLGHGLDRSLFDVTRIAAAKQPNHRLPVTISYQGTAPSLPGVTLTKAAGGIAEGYLTPASSLVFGRAVNAQAKADAAAGHTGSPLFTGVRSISADVAGAPATAHPNYVQYTLKVKVTGPDGKPEADGEIELANMDDISKVDDSVEVVDGEARFSVPKGHYAAIALDSPFDANGVPHIRISTVTQYDVTGSGQTLKIDYRKATLTPTAVGPKPATQQSYDFIEQRLDAIDSDDYLSFQLEADGPLDFHFSPAPAATVGSLGFFQKWSLAGGHGTGAYTYDLATGADRIPNQNRYSFSAKSLATIRASYYGDGGKHTSSFFRSADYPGETQDAASYIPLTLGTRRTEYVGATGTPTWSDEVDLNAGSVDDAGALDTPDRKLPAGSTRTASWLRGPIAAGIPHQTGPQGGNEIADEDAQGECFACRTTKYMALYVRGVTDSDPSHFGDEYNVADGLQITRFRLYVNGKKTHDLDGVGDDVTVPAGKASYREVIDVDRRLADPTLSTVSETALTFGSTANTGRKLPSDWQCDVGASCRVLPLVLAKLALPTDLQGRLPVGKSTVTVSVASLQNSTPSAATGATLQIRPADGQWTPVKLTSIGGGKYRGTIDDTSDLAGDAVDVKFTGKDKAGSTFTQTVVRAYTVAGS